MNVRRLTYAFCVLMLSLGATLVPMPWFSVRPGNAVMLEDLIEVRGEPTTELDGATALLAVRLGRPSLIELIESRFRDDTDLLPVSRYLRAGQEDSEYFANQALVFDDAFDIAAAVALEAAGFPVTIATSPTVLGVGIDGPAEGHLLAGDLVITINGVAVANADELVAEAGQLQIGDAVTLVVERGGETVETTFAAGQTPRMSRPGLGITVDTIVRDLQLPFDVSLVDDVAIGGPSAGLLFTLTIYDLVAQENLLGGLRVTGTGTMSLNGSVGNIGSIRQKVKAAIRDGYDVFLAPRAQADDARLAAGGEIMVIGVATFNDAIEALRDAPRAS